MTGIKERGHISRDLAPLFFQQVLRSKAATYLEKLIAPHDPIDRSTLKVE